MLVIDTETGGTDPARCALVSIAAVHSSGVEFHAIVRPAVGWQLEDAAMEVHGMSKQWLLENGESEPEVMRKFALWYGVFSRDEWGGCNPRFDMDFVNAAWTRCGMDQRLGYRPVCLGSLAWAAHVTKRISLPKGRDGAPKRSLDAILAALGMKRSGEKHGALEDARLTLGAFEKIMEKISMEQTEGAKK